MHCSCRKAFLNGWLHAKERFLGAKWIIAKQSALKGVDRGQCLQARQAIHGWCYEIIEHHQISMKISVIAYCTALDPETWR